jgi:hypothetical protein
MSWFGLLRLAAPYLIGAGLVLGATAYLYEKGRTDERNSNVAKVLAESEEARKLREKNDAGEHSRSDDDALKCLRNPNGCR